MKKIKKLILCLTIIVCYSCNDRKTVDDLDKISNVFYYKYIDDNNEMTISLTKKKDIMNLRSIYFIMSI